MSEKTASEIIVAGFTILLYPWDKNNNDYSDEAKQLCGVDAISFTDGTVEKKDITDGCDAKTGFKREAVGLKSPGSASFNPIRYDPKQEGQKWLQNAAPNTKFKAVIQLEDDTATIHLRKETSASLEIKVGEQLSGSIECATESDIIWS